MSPARGGGGAVGLDHEDQRRLGSSAPSSAGLADRIAAVGDAEGAGKLELDEGEEAQRSDYSPTWAAEARSRFFAGSEYFDGFVGTVGLSIVADLADQALPLVGLEELDELLVE